MARLGIAEILIIFVILLPFYFLPTIIAISSKKSNRIAIFILNFFLGWTFLGWIVSLVWAFTSNSNKPIINNTFSNSETESKKKEVDNTFENLQKLKNLLDSGILTQAEFDEQKAKILQK